MWKLYWIFIAGVTLGGASVQYNFTGSLWSNNPILSAEERCIFGAEKEARKAAKELGLSLYAKPTETIEWCKKVF